MTWPPRLDGVALTRTSGVHTIHAIEFAIVEGFRPLQIDVHVPPSAPSAPAAAVLYLHGGGWRVGSRRRFGRAFRSWDPSPIELLALAGLVVVCVDYRLSGEARFPAALHDAKAAVRWMRAKADALRIDSDRIVAWGESAGGHLALLLGVSEGIDELEGTVGDHVGARSDVAAVVDWYGHTDLLAASSHRHASSTSDHDAPDSYESLLLGAPLQTVPDLARLASPITHVHAAAAPVQIHHGDADLAVPYGQSVAFEAALSELEVPVELVTIPGADHHWIGAPSVEAIFHASRDFAASAAARVVTRASR